MWQDYRCNGDFQISHGYYEQLNPNKFSNNI